jgi:hypothetical protein
MDWMSSFWQVLTTQGSGLSVVFSLLSTIFVGIIAMTLRPFLTKRFELMASTAACTGLDGSVKL